MSINVKCQLTTISENAYFHVEGSRKGKTGIH